MINEGGRDRINGPANPLSQIQRGQSGINWINRNRCKLRLRVGRSEVLIADGLVQISTCPIRIPHALITFVTRDSTDVWLLMKDENFCLLLEKSSIRFLWLGVYSWPFSEIL